MANESNRLPTSRLVRWIALGVLIACAIALYFRDGLRLAPLAAPVPASPTAAGVPGDSTR